MSRKLNLYLIQADIEKIQDYLSARDFVFIKDEILSDPVYVPQNQLFSGDNWARFITFPDAHLNFQSFQDEELQKYRLSIIGTEAMRFGVFGKQGELFRLRFYYDIFDFQDVDPKQTELHLSVERFFRWLRRQFKRVPDMPTFYYNPDFPPKEWF